VRALFTKFVARAFLQQNLGACAGGETLATLATLAGCQPDSEKQQQPDSSGDESLGRSGSAECATAKVAKVAKVRQLEPLRVGTGSLSPADWRSRFVYRKEIAEQDRGLSPPEAERCAFECCVIEWLNANPKPSPAGICTWCGQADTKGSVVLPFGSDPGTHAWLHATCWQAWHQSRRIEAIATLASFGIQLRDEQSGTAENKS
jgi:hypothetical protein